MIAVTYVYADFTSSGGDVDVAALDDEIRGSSISNTLIGVTEDPDAGNVNINFTGTSLSGPDQTTLDNLIANHLAIQITVVETDTFPSGVNLEGSNLFGVGQLSVSGSAFVTGSIVIQGTVDGRDVSVDGTKLDGIEAGAEVDDKDVQVSANDTTPGFLFTKLVAGSNIQLTEQNDGGNETLQLAVSGTIVDLEQFSAYDSAGSTTTNSTTFVDIPLGTQEIATSAFSHTPGNATVTINETGTYIIHGEIMIDQGTGNSRSEVSYRLVRDTGGGFNQVNGTFGYIYSRNNAQGGGNGSFTIIIQLDAGDIIKMQFNRTSGAGTINSVANGTSLSIHNAKGLKGDKGDTGAGSTVLIEDNDVSVVSASILNFGDGLTVTNDGGGQVTIDAGDVDLSFNSAEDAAVSTTTSTTFQTKVSLNSVALSAGTYRLDVSYGWNHDATDSDFEGQVQEDSGGGFTTLGEIHKQEPKDSAGTFGITGTTQRHFFTRYYVRVLTAGTYSWRIQYRTDASGAESSIWDAVISVFMVSS